MTEKHPMLKGMERRKTMKRSLLIVIAVSVVVTLICACDKKSEVKPQPKAAANVYELIGLLDSQDPAKQQEAADKLAKLGPQAKVAIPALIRKASSRNIFVKLAAERALVSMGEDTARVLVKEVGLLGSGDMDSILVAIGRKAVPVIVKEMETTRSREKQASFLLTLGRMESEASDALPVIKKMQAKENDPIFATMIESTIAMIESGLEGLQGRMARSLEESERKLARLQQEVADASLKIAEELISLDLEINSPEVDALMAKVGTDLDTALPQLSPMLDDDPKSRLNAIVCLGRLGKATPANADQVIPYLQQGLEDEMQFIQTLSAVILVELGQKEQAKPYLLAAVSNPSDGMELMFALGGMAKGKIVVEDQFSLELIKVVLALAADEPRTASLAAVVLTNSGVYEEVIPVMEKMLESPDQEARTTATAILWRMGSNAEPAAAALKAAQRQETDPDLKMAMEMAIAAMGRTEDDLDTILANLKSSDLTTRLQAEFKLREIDSADKQRAVSMLLQMWETGNARTQDMIVRTICDFGADAKQASPLLLALLKESINENDTDRQFRTANVLGEIGEAEVAPLLVELLRSNEEAPRIAALVAFNRLGSKARAVIPDLIQMTEDPELCEDALGVLRNIGLLETEAQAASLVELLESESDMNASLAMFTLVDIGESVAVKPLLAKLNSPKKMARLYTITALGRVGKNDPRVIPALQAAQKTEQDERVLQEIETTLEKLTSNPAQ